MDGAHSLSLSLSLRCYCQEVVSDFEIHGQTTKVTVQFRKYSTVILNKKCIPHLTIGNTRNTAIPKVVMSSKKSALFAND